MRTLKSGLIFLWLICSVCSEAANGGKSIDDLISEIYPNPNGDQDPFVDTDPNLSTSTKVPNRINDKPDPGGIDLQPNGGGSIDNGNCPCVPYYLCNNGTVNTNGEGIIDIRIDDDNPCGGANYLEICCKKEDQVKVPITPRPLPTRNRGCGYRNPDGIGFRITGANDNEAQFGEFPWMVAVLREENVESNGKILNVYQCGGALVHPQVVITAAHCVAAKADKKLKVRAGEWDTQTTKEIFPHEDRNVENFVVHPQYYAGALYNDIAILFLDEPFKITENIDILCLPNKDFVADNARCFATGWGKDVYGKEGKYQVILKKIDLPIVPRGACQEALRKTRLGKVFELHQSFICAGGEPGKDTCKGDGGSPLVCPIAGQNDRFVHTGIVAWGIGCGDSDTPGVYVNVPLFRDWIDDQIGYKNLKLDTY